MRALVRIAGVLFLAVACAPTPASVVKGSLNVDALIEGQINLLSQRRVTLAKEAEVGDFHSDSTFVPTPEGWKSELDIFRQLGMINKSIYQGAYLELGTVDDPKSNLLILQYSSATAPLALLKIYYMEKVARIRKIEGLLMDATTLYSMQRNLTVEFEDEGGDLVLTRYSVAGYQKVAMGDTVRFSVRGNIHW